MSDGFYRVLHLVGILMTFLSIGSMVAVAREKGETRTSTRKFAAMFHGIGLLLVVVAGFGLLAKMNLGFEGYIIGKLALWLLLGGLGAVILRAPRLALASWWIALALGGAAAYLVWYRPF